MNNPVDQPKGELLPCPGCERSVNEPHDTDGDGVYFVDCAYCGWRGPRAYNLTDAFNRWNRRAARVGVKALELADFVVGTPVRAPGRNEKGIISDLTADGRAFVDYSAGGGKYWPLDQLQSWNGHRDDLGRQVRAAWIKWAMTQPAPKASWLVPYDQLSEPDKEADRQIGEAISLYSRSALIGIPGAEAVNDLIHEAQEIADYADEGGTAFNGINMVPLIHALAAVRRIPGAEKGEPVGYVTAAGMQSLLDGFSTSVVAPAAADEQFNRPLYAAPTSERVQALTAVEPGPDGKEWAKTEAGYAHVESVLASAVEGRPAGLTWYGYTVREAFVAGAEWQEARTLKATKDRAITDLGLDETGPGDDEIEIEITPRMIAAGVSALYGRDWGDEPGEWVIERVYRKMELARVGPRQKST